MPGPTLDADGLRRSSTDRIAKYKIPSHGLVPHETQLPRNANGKFLKRELRTELLGS